MTPREAWHRYLDGRRTEITEETASTYHYRLKLFVEWCEENGIETVSELNGWTLDQYESARSGEGIAATTLHNEMETIEKFVEYLERIEAVDDWLADRVNIPDVPPIKSPVRRNSRPIGRSSCSGTTARASGRARETTRCSKSRGIRAHGWAGSGRWTCGISTPVSRRSSSFTGLRLTPS
jgi:hypothetical protein